MLLIKHPLVYILWGTHGNEAVISRPLSELLFNKLLEINPKGTYVIGPVSPWSCRKEFRFDRLMSDPNRILNESMSINTDYFELLRQWRHFQPKDLKQLQSFLIYINQIGLNIGQLFTYCQSSEQDFFGYVNFNMQLKRIQAITNLISSSLDQAIHSHITLIDVHAGIGEDAKTSVFYEGNGKIYNSKFLIDALSSNIYQRFHIPVRTLILETGVVNNGFGLINVLSEIAARTYGFDQPVPKISEMVSSDWIITAINQFNLEIIGDI